MAANAAKALAKLNLDKNHAAFLEKLEAIDEAVRGAYDGETMNEMLPMPQEDWKYNWQAKIDAILLKLGW